MSDHSQDLAMTPLHHAMHDQMPEKLAEKGS